MNLDLIFTWERSLMWPYFLRPLLLQLQTLQNKYFVLEYCKIFQEHWTFICHVHILSCISERVNSHKGLKSNYKNAVSVQHLVLATHEAHIYYFHLLSLTVQLTSNYHCNNSLSTQLYWLTVSDCTQWLIHNQWHALACACHLQDIKDMIFLQLAV